jgi:hypothetical protein
VEPVSANPNPFAGFILAKTIATNSPKRIENAKILIANTCERVGPFRFRILVTR